MLLSGSINVPEASIYRLSLYHCYLGELLRGGNDGRVTSGRLSEELDLKEETVRRDLSFVGSVGRPGAGYQIGELFAALQDFLGLSDEYPIIRIGSAEMLRALRVVFPPSAYGVKPVAYFSENPEDVGIQIDDLVVQHVTSIPEVVPGLGATVAIIACSPGWVQIVVDLCGKGGIDGALVLTPALLIKRPEGMNITHMRMPCDVKSLACRVRAAGAMARE